MATLRTARVLLQSRDSVKWRPKDASASVSERNLDAVEAFHLANGFHNVRKGRRRLDITVAVKLRVDLGLNIDVKQARAAWIALRQRHPAIASTIRGSKRVHRKLGLDHINIWLNQTFVTIESHAEVTAELLDSLPASETAAMYFLSDSNTFALRVPHHLMDTLGTVMVLNDFLQELSEMVMGKSNSDDSLCTEELDDLACSLKEAASLPSASVSQLGRFWNVRRHWARSYPSVGVMPDQENPQSGLASWRDLEYSPLLTRDFVTKAGKHKMTVAHVVHAGVAFASKEYGPFTLTRNYNTVLVLDMRRPKDPSPKNAISPQHAIWPVTIDVTTFWRTAEQLKKAYQDAESDPDLPALVEPAFAEIFQDPPSCPTFYSAPIVGSFGKIDDYLGSSYGGFTVEDFHLSSECSGEEIVVAVWSYQGKLRIRLMFNEGYHSVKSMERYLSTLETVLRDGVGVWRCREYCIE
ncbi:uncharacterized protein DSM5745_06911 [Aspergillus mulundensis]|uniref:Condensation domain-containing protein n=1 Tax=Aspergillus mulundensis TaxID=1810919 RepID=A0A3D8RJN0_9EURO|nr:Uncharacterized protein DSM5745_06911 [Aspergillus mulundensis]RDW74249.1 Uncharacterized protein DSM5745_06911 [Aspergillus mulundensis]